MATAAKRLKAARRKRSQIASTLKLLRDDKLHLEDVLSNLPKHLGSVRIYVLLLNAHGLGESGVKRVLEKSKIYAAQRVGTLGEEDTARILRHLPPRARG